MHQACSALISETHLTVQKITIMNHDSRSSLHIAMYHNVENVSKDAFFQTLMMILEKALTVCTY